MSVRGGDGSTPTFRWGILGSGAAAADFVLGLRHADGAAAVVVSSRTPANARAFADRFAIPVVAADYRRAIAEHEVDAFYLATPPTEHCPLAFACLDAGRPVLVEKPLAVDREAAAEIVRVARRRSVFCMEALWTRFLPLTRRVKRMVDEGAVGEVRVVTGSFGRPTVPADRPGLFAAGSGGGALPHRGIYPLSLATHLMGPPELVSSHADLRAGVDVDSVVVARHPGGGISVSTASLVTHGANDLVVQGTRGTLHVLGPIYRPYRLMLTRAGPSGGPAVRRRLGDATWPHVARQRLGGLRARAGGRHRTVRAYYRGNGYQYEADEVARCVRAGRAESPVMPLEESLAIAEVLTGARRLWTA
jgi:predicted dehydrogenase